MNSPLVPWRDINRRAEDEIRTAAPAGVISDWVSYNYVSQILSDIVETEEKLRTDKSPSKFEKTLTQAQVCRLPYDTYLNRFLPFERKGLQTGNLTLSFRWRHGHSKLAWEYLRRSKSYRTSYATWLDSLNRANDAFKFGGEDLEPAIAARTHSMDLEKILCSNHYISPSYGLVDPDTDIPPIFQEKEDVSHAVDIAAVWRNGRMTETSSWKRPENGILVSIDCNRPREEVVAEFLRKLDMLTATDGVSDRRPLHFPIPKYDRRRPLQGDHRRQIFILDALSSGVTSAGKIYRILAVHDKRATEKAVRGEVERAVKISEEDYAAIAFRRLPNEVAKRDQFKTKRK